MGRRGLEAILEQPAGSRNKVAVLEKARAPRGIEIERESQFSLLGENIQHPGPVELGMRELISVAAEAPVATRVAAAIALHAFRGGAKYVAEDLFVFQLRHQAGAAWHIVVEHDRGLTRAVSPR